MGFAGDFSGAGRLRALAAGLACVALLAGCADRVPKIELEAGVQRPDAGAIVFLVDGMEKEVFRQMQEAGELPNITRHFIETGVAVEGAAASLPTITYANNTSLLTGMFPGHHDIVGNRWFDRNKLWLQDYNFIATYRQVNEHFIAPTIYEMMREDFTASISIPVKRGATRDVDNWMSMGVAWFFNMHETVNQLAILRLELLSDMANQQGRWPRLIVTYFPTSDTIGHRAGAKSEAYRKNLRDLDKTIGQALEALSTAGLYETTYRVLVTDHGFEETPLENVTELAGLMREWGIETRWKRYGKDKSWQQRYKHFAAARAVVVSGGQRRSNIYLRAGDYWHERPGLEEIESFLRDYGDLEGMCSCEMVQGRTMSQLLAELPGVDVVALRESAESIRVVSSHGAGRISRTMAEDGKRYRYEVLWGQDPLGMAAHEASAELIDGGYYASRHWLAATSGTERPDVVPQLPELFDSHRTGDLVVFAAEGWSFGPGELGGHGGLLRKEIIVPFFVAGPGLPEGAVAGPARTVDLTPTLLNLLGRGDKFNTLGPADGMDMSPMLRDARPRSLAIPQDVETCSSR